MWHKQEPTARGELDDEFAEDVKSTRGGWAICMFAIPTAAIAGFAAFYMSVCDPAAESGHNGLIGDVICRADPSSHKSVGVRVAGETGQIANPAGPVPEGLAKYARGSLGKLLVAREPRAVADDASFSNVKGERHTLADWKGKVVLVNVWATWCGPCKLEMPSLDRLQGKMGGPNFTVLAVSVNRDGVGKPQAFFQENKITNLEVLNDETSQFTSKMKAGGLPATVLLDREGREIARILGPAEWDLEEALSMIREAVGR